MKLEQVINIFETYAAALLLLAVILAFMVGLVAVTLFALNRRWLVMRKTEWLEITPPASVSKTPEATEQLFSVIHGQYAARPLKDRLLRRVPVMSFEITSTRKDGIRYLVQIEANRSIVFQKAMTAYIPDAKVKGIDYSLADSAHVVEFKETGHYVLPLTLLSAFEQHDPLAYVTGAMTKLEDNESVTLQLVIKPVKSREADKLARQIMANEDILATVNSGGLKAASKVTDMVNGVLTNTLDLASEVYYEAATSYRSAGSSRSNVRDAQVRSQIARRERPARTISAFELELMGSMHKKITEPLFQVDLRVLITGNNAKNHALAFRSALDGYSVPRYQSLKVKMKLPFIYGHRVKLAAMRLPALFAKNSLVLSSSEVASLYHFPSTRISRTDNLVTSLSRTLPAPISLKQHTKFDVLLGENTHREVVTPIGLTAHERERHVYIIGGTGNGKTTLIKYSLIQDIQNGKGVALVDPHGDLAEELLHYIPPERLKDVIYFNPDDLEYPFALNLLELTPGLEGNDLLREKDIITESVVSIFRKIFSEDDSGGHRIEYVLRNTIHTALTIEGATLFTILKLLQNASYRRSVVNALEDEDLKDFWKNEMGKAGDMQKVKMAAGITAKIGRFNVNAAAKAILGQEKSTLNFEDIIDSGKILICNLSKGMLGEDVSELFGITVLAKLQLASLRRARQKQTERRAFYLYVDEFQNFATPSFVQMLSESRKYKLFMTMAEQSTSQQKDQHMVSIILANVGTVICFRTGNPNDERLLLPLFSPYIGEGEIANLPAYNFYAKLSSVTSQEPLSGRTVTIKEVGDLSIADKVIRQSRDTYAKNLESQTFKRNKVIKIDTELSSNDSKRAIEKSVNHEAIVPPGG